MLLFLVPFWRLVFEKCWCRVLDFHVKKNSARLQWYSYARYKAPETVFYASYGQVMKVMWKPLSRFLWKTNFMALIYPWLNNNVLLSRRDIKLECHVTTIMPIPIPVSLKQQIYSPEYYFLLDANCDMEIKTGRCSVNDCMLIKRDLQFDNITEIISAWAYFWVLL